MVSLSQSHWSDIITRQGSPSSLTVEQTKAELWWWSSG